ncbi:MAG TPA: FtsX-like permease family protein [Caldilineaceae bacterium]|nr:FtsX-like permease family protein [Caldilineaceae bacterium]
MHGHRHPITHLRWRYIGRTLWLYRARAMLIVLSVAVGLFAFGLIAGAGYMLRTELPARYQEVNPASAVLHTSPFDTETVEAIRRMPEVAAAEGRTVAMLQYQHASGEWRDLQVFALQDYTSSQVNMVRPYRGPWPPPDHQALVERNSLAIMGLAVGDSLLVENDAGDRRRLPIAGLTHDMNQPPAQITDVPYAYVTRDTLEWLGLPRTFNELHLLVAEGRLDKAHITRVAQEATDKLERSGLTVYWTEVPEPGEHFVEDFLPTILVILGSLALLALILSSFLVINVIAALLTQQVRQIGIMKAIGARTAQIAAIYVRMVLCFGAGALVLAIPLGMIGARLFARFIAAQLNFDLADFRPAPAVLALEVMVGLATPVAAALWPILATARKTVREALQETGLEGEGPPQGTLARRLLALQQQLPLSRPLRLSLRNTFRRRGRLARTLLPLSLGGAIFMSVLSVRASLFRTLEETLVERGFDVQVQFSRPYQVRRIEYEVAQVEGVATLESWTAREAVPVHADGSQGDSLRVYALPATTQVFQPNLVAGRWLRPDDANALVIPTSLLALEPGFALSQTVTLRIGNEETNWQIVGINQLFQPPLVPAAVYVNQPYFWQEMGAYGRSDTARILTTAHDAATHRRVAQALENRLQAAGLKVKSIRTATEDRTVFTERFNIITIILLIMAFLLATVGSLGLMGTMSINVLERRREIGVMRAIGASDQAILRIVVAEGMVISLLSWAGAALLSQPMGRALSFQVGMNFAKLPLSYVYDLRAPVLWLLIIVVVSVLASLAPARSATAVSVRETLAYE